MRFELLAASFKYLLPSFKSQRPTTNRGGFDLPQITQERRFRDAPQIWVVFDAQVGNRLYRVRISERVNIALWYPGGHERGMNSFNHAVPCRTELHRNLRQEFIKVDLSVQ